MGLIIYVIGYVKNILVYYNALQYVISLFKADEVPLGAFKL